MPSRPRRGSSFGNPPEVEEQRLGFILAGKIAASIVLAVVVVVPGREHRNRRADLAVARDLRRPGVGFGERRAGGAGREVAIDVVAGEDEELRPVVQHGVPDRLRQVLVGAGAEGDPRQRRAVVGARRAVQR